MARKLISGNDVVGFNASNGTITINGYVPLSKLLLINNATLNTILYNFSDPNLTATCNTSGANSTVITLTNYNSSNYPGISNTDKIQIYYEKEELEIKPTRTYRDPVSKFRVSTPETLIDTDFEYGLQPTKWETLKLVNNVPTSYSSTNPEDALTVSSVSVGNGSNVVTVITTKSHSLIPGSIIEIVGLTVPTYEGNFIVDKVTSSTKFTYNVAFKSSSSSETVLNTIYTLVYPGAFYTGSSVDIDDVSTNQVIADPNVPDSGSKLTLKTQYYHGFNQKTKLYLKKSRATNLFSFLSPENVVAAATTTYSATIDGNTTSPITDYYSNKPIITEDYFGDFEINVDNASLNVGAGSSITYELSKQIGAASLTPIQKGDVVVFYTPAGNQLPSVGGGKPLERFTPLHVINSTTTNGIVSFTVASVYGSQNTLSITAGASTPFGNHRFMKGFKVNTVSTSQQVSCATSTTFVNGDRVVAISTFANNADPNSANFKFTKTTGQQVITPGTNFQEYNISQVVSSTQLSGIGKTFTLDNTPNNTRVNRDFTASNSNFIALVKLKKHPLANALYLPQSAGFSTTPFYDGFHALYTCNTPNAPIGGITTNTKYYLKQTTQKDWYNLYSSTDITLTQPLQLYYNDANFIQNVFNGPHTFSRTVDVPGQHSIEIISPDRGGLADDTDVVYSSKVSAIGNLVSNQSYKVKALDGLLKPTQLRLSNTAGITSIHSIAHTGLTSTTSISIYAGGPHPTLSACGIDTGNYIEISGFDAKSADGIVLNTLYQGLHKVLSWKLADQKTYPNVTILSVEVAPWKNIEPAITVPNTNQDILKTTKVIGIVTFTNQGGIGTHVLSQNNDGAVDGLFTIKDKTDKEFVFSTNKTIPNIVKTITGINTGISSTSSLKVNNHNFADGTIVTYETTGLPMGGLTSTTDYYIRVLDQNFVAISSTADGATNRTTTDLLIGIGSTGSGTHSFTTNSVKGFLTGTGTIGFTTTSNIITGSNTKFFTDFTNGDLFRIYKLTNSGTGPGTYFESKVTSIKSDTILKLESNPSFSSGSSNYFVPTRLYAISDGKAVHRPFDGGVSMTTGLVPNTQIIRQTRKYFRYQSGKGIQVSKAINFNPTFDIDQIFRSTPDGSIGSATTTMYKVTTKYAHQISKDVIGTNQKVKISNVVSSGTADEVLNSGSGFRIVGVPDDFNFVVDASSSSTGNDIGGFSQYCVVNWQDAYIKCGMFDDQNGFFFKYDGNILYAVRRSSTQQLSGSFTVERNSHTVTGVNSLLISQLSEGDRIVIRGQTYKVTKVISDTKVDVQPAYRGGTTSNVVISKVIDTAVPQSEWNIDRMDGTGESGYKLDLNKIQMIYMDYSWYGAGSIRFGFKDQYGEVRYCHEFVHNNIFTESYFRSGNIPSRYEVETGNNPLFAPSLFHWGASIIMDGRFDDDKAYLFTAESNPLPFTNGGLANKSAAGDSRPQGTITTGSNIITDIDGGEAGVLAIGETIEDSASATTFPTGTTITSIQIDQTAESKRYQNTYSLVVSNNALGATGSKTFNIYSGTSALLQGFIPLVSIRLAPAVDNASISNLGYRDIINRMQLTLKSAGVLTSHDCEVRLIFNAKLSNDDFVNVGAPSLSQIYRHKVGDTYSGGTNVFAFRAQGGTVVNSTTGRRSFNGTDVSLVELALLGNSILGGDGVYPDGPDVITVAVKPVDTSQITGSSPLVVTGRITWTEAQA